MRRFLNNKTLLVLLQIMAVVFAMPHFAHAGAFLPDWMDTAGSILGNITSTFMEVLILPLAAAILTLSGLLLDQAIQLSLHTAYIFSLSPAINLGWTIIRDLANIFFIFILIWISLGTIVNGLRFGTSTMLKYVVIAAILINFSLFITKAVIDVSNIFGNWLYTGVEMTLAGSATPGSTPSLSSLIVTRMQLNTLWTDPLHVVNYSDPAQSFTGRILRLAVTLIAIYIFLYAAVLFLARSIELLFLLIFSPIGFMGKILPQIEDYAKEWRKELTSVAMFPLIFLIMLYLSLQFINSMEPLSKAFAGATATAPQIPGSAFTVAQYFNYFIIIFLLQATIKISKKYSGEMGEKLGGMAEGLGKLAVNATMAVGSGGAALVGRSLIGRAASGLASNGTFQDYAAGVKGNRFTQFVAEHGLKGTVAVSKSSFDLRGSSAFKKGVKELTGLDTGKPILSYDAKKKDIEKNETEFSKLLGKGVKGEQRRATYGEKLGGQILYNISGSGALAQKVGEDLTEKSQKGERREEINAQKKKLFEMKLKSGPEITKYTKLVSDAENNLEKEQTKLASMVQFNLGRNEINGQEEKVNELIKGLENLKTLKKAAMGQIEETAQKIKDLQAEYRLTQKIEGEEEKGGGKKKKDDEDEGEEKEEKKGNKK